MNPINSIWTFIAIVICLPISLWLMTWMSPIISLMAGTSTALSYIITVATFVFVFALTLVVPTAVLFGTQGNMPFGMKKKKEVKK